MKKLLALIAFVCLALPALGQNTTTVSASNIMDINGTKLAAGQLCFLVTDQSDNPISVSVGGGGQTLKRGYCSPVTTGAVTSFTVPNPATTSPSGIYYRVTVKDTSTGLEVLRYTGVTFSGGTFNFDNYQPVLQGASLNPLTGNSVTANLNVSGNIAATGTVLGSNIPASISGTGSCTNQFVTALNPSAAPTCTTDVLASAQHANQGTTTTVLHGNAAGNPSFGAVVQGDVSNGYVDLSSTQNVGGAKTFTTSVASPSFIGTGALELTGNSGLPAATNTNLWEAGAFGSPILGKFYVGDGSGWELDFAKRTGSTDTTLFKMKDTGEFDAITLSGTFVNGRPWIDPTGPPYNAKCDGATDDSTALQSWLTALNAGGFDGKIPNTGHPCNFGTQLNMNGFNDVAILGVGSGESGTGAPFPPLPALMWTGTGTGSAITCKTCANVSFKGVAISYSNAGFTGILVDLSQNTTSSNTLTLQDCHLGGNGTGVSATLLNLDKVINMKIDNCTFNWAAHAMTGASSGASPSNTVRISNSAFNGAGSCSISGAYITNPSQGWTFVNDTFELIGCTNQSIIDATGSNIMAGTALVNPWIGDGPAGYSGTLFKIGNNGGIGVGFSIVGGYIQGGSSNLGTVVSTSNAAHGISITGVDFANWASIINLGGSNDSKGVFIIGNSYTNVTAINTGTNPASGMTTDLNGNPQLWCQGVGANPCVVSGTGGLDINAGAPFAESEGTVPAATAGRDVTYADSTLHSLMVSNNNGSFGVLGTNKITLAADWACGTGGTVSSCTSATIIGSTVTPMTFNLPLVAANYKLRCHFVIGQATGATSNQWNLLTATNGATNVTASYSMATAATASAYGAVTDQGSTTTTFQIAPNWTLGGTGTKMPVDIYADIQGASASGTVLSVQVLAPTVGDLLTFYRGSGCWIY